MRSSEGRRRTFLFQQAFLDNIRRNGRLCELELIGAFKTKAFLADGIVSALFKDALLAPQVDAAGKVALLRRARQAIAASCGGFLSGATRRACQP